MGSMPIDASQAGQQMPAESAAIVPLLAVAGQVALPYELAMLDDGGLEFGWQPSQTREKTLADPVVRGTIRRGSSPAGSGWIVRSSVEVTGDDGAKARWCDARNAAGADGSADGGVVTAGSWELAADGTCCLTAWFSQGEFADQPTLTATLLANVLRAQQDAVLRAVLAVPETVVTSPLSPHTLAAGLTRVAAVFRSYLEYPPGYSVSVSAEEAGVVVRLEGFCLDDLAVPLAQTAGRSFQTAVTVCAACNRAELGLVYAALLAQSTSRVPTPHGYDLVPGEFASESFADGDVEAALVLLSKGDVVRYSPADDPVFPAGPAWGQLSFSRVSMARLYGSAPLRVSAGVSLPPGRRVPARDGSGIDVLGTWERRSGTLAYSVIVPPTMTVWAWPAMAAELLAWAGRHVIRQVQDVSRSYPP